MTQNFAISGMHCGGCVNRVTKALRALDAGVQVSLQPPQATFSAGTAISLEAINAALAKIGDYRASEAG